MANEPTTTTFTAGETSLLISMLKNLDGDIKFDADAVAAELGYKDGTIVKARWNQIKRKKIAHAGSSPTTAGVKKTPASGKKTPAKRIAAVGGGDDGDTPTKPKRGRKAKAQKAVKEEEEGEADEQEGEADEQDEGEKQIVKAEVMDEAGEEDETGGL